MSSGGEREGGKKGGMGADQKRQSTFSGKKVSRKNSKQVREDIRKKSQREGRLIKKGRRVAGEQRKEEKGEWEMGSVSLLLQDSSLNDLSRHLRIGGRGMGGIPVLEGVRNTRERGGE